MATKKGSKKRANPVHFPKKKTGPKPALKWWIVDLFNTKGQLITSHIRKMSARPAKEYAGGMLNSTVSRNRVNKVELSGPYARKPGAGTVRK